MLRAKRIGPRAVEASNVYSPTARMRSVATMDERICSSRSDGLHRLVDCRRWPSFTRKLRRCPGCVGNDAKPSLSVLNEASMRAVMGELIRGPAVVGVDSHDSGAQPSGWAG